MMHRVIFHPDMDAFYASVGQWDNPSLKGNLKARQIHQYRPSYG
jgi:hypothetical protein